MKAIQKWAGTLCATLFVLTGVAACSGSSHHNDGSGGDGGDGGVDPSKSCIEQFNPDKLAAGEDCTPSYNQFCPDATSPSLTNDQQVGACDGVTVTDGTVTSGGLTSHYVVLTPSTGGKKALVIGLHWSNGTGESMANHMRMSELAKARDVTVVLPTAPDIYPFRTWGNSVVIPISTRDERVGLIDELITQVQGTTSKATLPPVLLTGTSGGAVMALEYLCDRSEMVSGIEMVAAEVTASMLEECHPTTPVATVQVQGTSDPIGSYDQAQAAFSALSANNGCVADDVAHASMPPADGELIDGIDVAWISPCTSGKGSAFVTIEGGGHNYPGLNRNFTILPIDLFGPVTAGFDATLQGYDLLRYLGG